MPCRSAVAPVGTTFTRFFPPVMMSIWKGMREPRALFVVLLPPRFRPTLATRAVEVPAADDDGLELLVRGELLLGGGARRGRRHHLSKDRRRHRHEMAVVDARFMGSPLGAPSQRPLLVYGPQSYSRRASRPRRADSERRYRKWSATVEPRTERRNAQHGTAVAGLEIARRASAADAAPRGSRRNRVYRHPRHLPRSPHGDCGKADARGEQQLGRGSCASALAGPPRSSRAQAQTAQAAPPLSAAAASGR